MKNKTKNCNSSSLKKTWIKNVYRENQTLNVTQIAKKVTEESGINCTVKDINDFLFVPEDWELESRRHIFNIKNKYYER